MLPQLSNHMQTRIQNAPPVVSTDLFASDIDDETYVIRDKSGQQKMLMTRKPGNKWKLYALIDSDQYRSDLMERHGISHANDQRQATASTQP